jgi:Xaa-Pro aminopeptidase
MVLPLPAIQRTLAMEQIDGWLLYDFHGLNPIAAKLTGLSGSGRMATRRWFYFIPATGTPKKVFHAIERGLLDGVPGVPVLYSGRRQFEQQVTDMLRGCKVLAMEYSPECNIPYLSRVDGGTVDFLRRIGMRIISSGDLVQRFEASWDEAAIASHRAASERLYRIKDRAFAFIAEKLGAGVAITEYDVQQAMLGWFRESGLVTDHPPIVAAQEHAGNPHYAPEAEGSRRIAPNELVLLDLWGKLDRPGAVYADITWTGHHGTPPDRVLNVFDVAIAARDAAIARVQSAIASRQEVRGWEVDRAARDLITAAGYGAAFIHRTGHSLGEEVHGNGANMDDYETHDDRLLIAGTGFTIEPGIYTSAFGVRTEINMVVSPDAADVTGPCQTRLVPLGP